ncbi:MarR family transcriptional regulator [Sphaerisporangium siamense]|uniref:DNA-binding MarR family transcriptional regulator n=1 Tax=Sphaerisporangium siamense TaxID=795645 RepID=A0A7W7D665_9ACTN|nr:MarR family transcriptional regulator [Sphaerisporangium siamense]MBB4700040.1 DNA-binding MarR family transcriptional regulator [Sphaerisporangium siamense]GII84642.1 MarR family transcriptional regulator [Sphaerisporangium siamense]
MNTGPQDPAGGTDDQVLTVMPRLAQLSNAISRGRLIEHAMKTARVEVDRPAFSVLVSVHMAGKPLRISEIAEQTQLVQPHVTRQVQQLERHGLVRRIGDPNDRRVSFIEPTDEGKAAADRYARTLINWFTGAIAHWSDPDRADLGRLLARFAEDITAHLATLEER